MLNTRVTVPASVKALLARIGEQLKTAREAQGLSREDICQSLKMHINFVIALEEGLYEDLPGAALFFASLRSYTRFLRLDANAVIEECKKNKFLFEALQGEGLIERVNRSNVTINQPLVKTSSSNNVPPPATLPKLQTGTTTNWKADETTTDKESKKNKTSQGKKILFTVSTVLFLIISSAALAFVYRYQLGINEYIDSSLEQMSSSFGGALTASKTCEPFQLIARESIEVKVRSLSVGDTIAERTLFPSEQLNFSDAMGVEIEISDPSSAELLYGGKPLDWDKMKRNGDSYSYKCR